MISILCIRCSVYVFYGVQSMNINIYILLYIISLSICTYDILVS